MLNNHFVYESKMASKLKPFSHTFLRYICAKCKQNKRFLTLRRKGEAQIERTLNVETLFRQSKIIRLMAGMIFKSKFEMLLAQAQRSAFVLKEESESEGEQFDMIEEENRDWLDKQVRNKNELSDIEAELVTGIFH